MHSALLRHHPNHNIPHHHEQKTRRDRINLSRHLLRQQLHRQQCRQRRRAVWVSADVGWDPHGAPVPRPRKGLNYPAKVRTGGSSLSFSDAIGKSFPAVIVSNWESSRDTPDTPISRATAASPPDAPGAFRLLSKLSILKLLPLDVLPISWQPSASQPHTRTPRHRPTDPAAPPTVQRRAADEPNGRRRPEARLD